MTKFNKTKHLAFISYRHISRSQQAARALELGLKRYARPFYKWPPSIFRDEKKIKPGDELSESINLALESSEFLILIACPEAVKSTHVKDELDRWCNQLGNGGNNLIIVHISGEIGFDADNMCIDWQLTDALPMEILKPHITYPLIVDLRSIDDFSQTNIDNLFFRERINDVAATLRGLLPEVMKDRELVNVRRNRRLVGAAFGVLILLSTGLFLTTNLALDQRDIAQEQTRISEIRLKRAESNLLVTRSDALADTAPDKALSLALDAWEHDQKNPVAHQAVVRSYYEPDAFPIHLLRKKLPNSSGTAISYFAQAFDKNSKSIWIVDREDPKHLINVSLNGVRQDLLLAKSVYDFRIDPFGDGFLTVNQSGATLWDENGRIVREYPYSGASFATISPDGSRIMVAGGYEGAANVFSRQGKLLFRLCCHGNTIMHGDFAISDDGWISTAGNKEARVWDARGELQYTIDHDDYVTSATISPNGKFLATTTWDSRVQVLWLATGKILKNLPGHSSRVYSANFSPDGQKLVTASWDGTVRVWDSRSMSTEVLLTLPSVEGQNVVMWSPDGNWLVASGSKTVTLWNVTKTKHLMLDFRTRKQVTDEHVPIDHFELKGGYRGVTVFREGDNFFTFEIPFKDHIYQGNFVKGGLFIDTNGNRRFPFNPNIIRELVYTQQRFGPLVRLPTE